MLENYFIHINSLNPILCTITHVVSTQFYLAETELQKKLFPSVFL